MPKSNARVARRNDGDAPDSIFALLPPNLAGDRTVRQIAVDRIEPNPAQPRTSIDAASLDELKASIYDHGVVQPILVRGAGDGRFELVAGERRWRAVVALGLPLIPAIVHDLSDEQAIEIAVIENLQREDLSPLDEATIFSRMTSELGYSIRKLAERLGKDKGYVENRLRLVAAPTDVRALVAARADTISHAYELMKLDDPARRAELAAQVARGDLPLARLKTIVRAETLHDDHRFPAEPDEPAAPVVQELLPYLAPSRQPISASEPEPEPLDGGIRIGEPSDDALSAARRGVAASIDELARVLRALDQPGTGTALTGVDRDNMAKWLQIARNKLDNLAAILRQKGE